MRKIKSKPRTYAEKSLQKNLKQIGVKRANRAGNKGSKRRGK